MEPFAGIFACLTAGCQKLLKHIFGFSKRLLVGDTHGRFCAGKIDII
jgi:hypothetical protein